MLWPFSSDFVSALEIDVLAEGNYLRGRAPHFFETGVGLTYWKVFDSGRSIPLGAVFRIGYRYQKPDGGFFFRFGVTPVYLLARHVENVFQPWVGLSFGFTLKPKNSDCAD